MVESWCHGVVFHSHEEGVENNADGYGQVNKRIHHDHVHNLLHLQPGWIAVPDQEAIGKFVPTRRALLP